MAIPSKQIGWSQKANLLWQISKQLERLICVRSCGCSTTTSTTTIEPTTTSTTTLPPTTTTTTSEAKPFKDLVYRAEKDSNACGQTQGGLLLAEGDGTTFCNSTTLTAAGFSALPPGELFISYGGQVRASNHGAGQNFVTFTTGCSACP